MERYVVRVERNQVTWLEVEAPVPVQALRIAQERISQHQGACTWTTVHLESVSCEYAVKGGNADGT